MEKKIKNKSNFCIRPFNSLVIDTDGALNVCCLINTSLTEYKDFKKKNIKENTIKQWWHSDYNKYLRQNFLQNNKLKECMNCWKMEEQGLSSLRTKSNQQYSAIFQNKFQRNLELIGKHSLSYPEDVELQITNLCNLKCQMCSGASSSKLLTENNALGFENSNQKDYDLSDKDYQKIKDLSNHDLRLLNVRGGEPLINKKTISLLYNLIQNKKAHKISLHVTTNGTQCDKEILSLFKHFKNVRLMISIEATEKQNEYIRYPSSWNTIKKNIEKFKTLPNTYIYINTVVQNLNILYIDKLIKYAYQNNIYIHLFKLEDPNYLEMFNLPKNILNEAYKKLSVLPDEKLVHTENIKEIIFLLKKKLDNYSIDNKKYAQFIDMIKKRDRYRKISIKDYMPEIAKEITT